MLRLRRKRNRLIQRDQQIRREGAARKAGKARRASPGFPGRLSDSEKKLVIKGMNWGRLRPGRVEKQLKRIAIVYGDNFQEF